MFKYVKFQFQIDVHWTANKRKIEGSYYYFFN